jgi:hypothetical protein
MIDEVVATLGRSGAWAGRLRYAFSNYALVLACNAVALEVPWSSFGILEGLEAWSSLHHTAAEDCLLRVLHEDGVSRPHLVQIHEPGQLILSRSCIRIDTSERVVRLNLNLRHTDDATLHLPPPPPSSTADYDRLFTRDLVALVEEWTQRARRLESSEVLASIVTAQTLRQFVLGNGGVAFIANGSMLARDGNDKALRSGVPFVSPPSLEREVTLPSGQVIKGALIPSGVTVITGGGFHGKSTLLRALALGAYDKVRGDGREGCVTASRALCLRSEDGRAVTSVDISPFISNLPVTAALDPACFSTSAASGSTSQAAAVIEGLAAGCSLFLLDEDTCAGNFMIRDSRMRSLIANEPITPFIYRVNSLWRQKGVSTIVVVGGSGDWFDVQDCTLLMDDYCCHDVTRRALQISKTFCTGRVEYNGRGLVHQLPWTHELRPRLLDLSPLLPLPLPRTHIRASEDGSILYYSPSCTLDVSKLEQRAAVGREGREATLGLGAALWWLASKRPQGLSLAELLDFYDKTREESIEPCRAVVGNQTFILPLSVLVGQAIDRLRCINAAIATEEVERKK